MDTESMTEPVQPARIVLPDVVTLPVEAEEMAGLRARLDATQTEDDRVAVYAAMVDAGGYYRAEVAALIAAGLSEADTTAVVLAVIAGYSDIIRSIGHDGLAEILVDIAKRSFAARLLEITPVTGSQFGTA